MSGQALDFGVEEHRIAGTIIRVFNPAKTVADCFKFRNKIGIEVANAPIPGVAVVGQIGSKKYPASVRARLRNIARERNVDFGPILVKYWLERILYLSVAKMMTDFEINSLRTGL